MKSHVRVAVIGGGVVGVSVLYHLTKLGWTDVALIERSELTSGSTWHAAGGMHTINGDTNMTALQAYTVRLYDELETESGQACGIHRVGCLYLATDETCMDYFRMERGRARHLRPRSRFRLDGRGEEAQSADRHLEIHRRDVRSQ